MKKDLVRSNVTCEQEENFYTMVEDFLTEIAPKEEEEVSSYWDMYDMYYQDVDSELGKFDASSSASRHRRRRRNMKAEKINTYDIAIKRRKMTEKKAISDCRALKRFGGYGSFPKYSREEELEMLIKAIEDEMESLWYIAEEDAAMFEIVQGLRKSGVEVKSRLFYTKLSGKHSKEYLPVKAVMNILKADRKLLKEAKNRLKRLRKNKSYK